MTKKLAHHTKWKLKIRRARKEKSVIDQEAGKQKQTKKDTSCTHTHQQQQYLIADHLVCSIWQKRLYF